MLVTTSLSIIDLSPHQNAITSLVRKTSRADLVFYELIEHLASSAMRCQRASGLITIIAHGGPGYALGMSGQAGCESHLLSDDTRGQILVNAIPNQPVDTIPEENT